MRLDDPHGHGQQRPLRFVVPAGCRNLTLAGRLMVDVSLLYGMRRRSNRSASLRLRPSLTLRALPACRRVPCQFESCRISNCEKPMTGVLARRTVVL
jgi:hypothetical protein